MIIAIMAITIAISSRVKPPIFLLLACMFCLTNFRRRLLLAFIARAAVNKGLTFDYFPHERRCELRNPLPLFVRPNSAISRWSL